MIAQPLFLVFSVITMRTLKDILGKKKFLKSDVGIEIEAEGEGMRIVDTAIWRTESDGSLRPKGGFPNLCAEFVLTQPIPVATVKPALQQLKEELAGAVFKFSSRCSVHIHVNVLNLEYQQMLAMIYAYYLLEEPFMTYCGKSRKGNNFCLRLADAEGQLDSVMGLIRDGEEGVYRLPGDRSRYSALNVEALGKYGSLEFRGMEGNLDVNRIDIWCNALVRLREFAVASNDPAGVQKKYQELGGKKFLDFVLGDLAEHFVYRGVGRDIDYGFSISFDFPLMWERVNAKAPVEYKDHEVGKVIAWREADAFMGRGGRVDVYNEENGTYVVKKRSTQNQKVVALF
jgi:hypothetical protein